LAIIWHKIYDIDEFIPGIWICTAKMQELMQTFALQIYNVE
jgi:hypothetical protein